MRVLIASATILAIAGAAGALALAGAASAEAEPHIGGIELNKKYGCVVGDGYTLDPKTGEPGIWGKASLPKSFSVQLDSCAAIVAQDYPFCQGRVDGMEKTYAAVLAVDFGDFQRHAVGNLAYNSFLSTADRRAFYLVGDRKIVATILTPNDVDQDHDLLWVMNSTCFELD